MVRSDKKGFTLIELMIVVAIIGILAAVAIPAYSTYTKKAKLTEVTNAMGAVGAACVEYYQAKGDYPDVDTILAIRDSLGITVPQTYVSAAEVEPQADEADGCYVIVTFNAQIDDDWDGDILTLQVRQGQRGAWDPDGSDTLSAGYIPKQ